ncbi:flagellin [Geothrix rubra]|uniref:Flagellin n=1 Tax=Geothrix rubra TaxID=2927977 RepID=A0ABQ5Q589_9BACT|nr:flagellin [Geothrix rubra]GLH69798.1 flagellin [Geothrix rubra]
MSLSILNNITGLNASRQLGLTQMGLNQTIERLTSGKRINKASDDAAGLGISNQLNTEVKVADQAQRNANDGVSLLQVADGALDTITNLLQRQAELTQQASTGTLDANGKANINAEYSKNNATIADILNSTTFNGTSVFSNTAKISVGSFAAVDLTTSLAKTSITSGTDASVAGQLSAVKADLQTVSTQRATLGASEATLNSYSAVLGIQSQNLQAASSQITDANIANEVVNLSKFQILNQSGISALGKSNQSAQSVLALLQ